MAQVSQGDDVVVHVLGRKGIRNLSDVFWFFSRKMSSRVTGVLNGALFLMRPARGTPGGESPPVSWPQRTK